MLGYIPPLYTQRGMLGYIPRYTPVREACWAMYTRYTPLGRHAGLCTTYKEREGGMLRREPSILPRKRGNLCAECLPFSLRREDPLRRVLPFSLRLLKTGSGPRVSLPSSGYSRFTVGGLLCLPPLCAGFNGQNGLVSPLWVVKVE